jgi:hypothetical protein
MSKKWRFFSPKKSNLVKMKLEKYIVYPRFFFPPKRGSKSPKNKNKTTCGPTSSNNLVCVACKFVQVEEEKEASRTIRTVDPMEEYMIFRCLPNQTMRNFKLDLKITLPTNSPYFCLYLLVEPHVLWRNRVYLR